MNRMQAVGLGTASLGAAAALGAAVLWLTDQVIWQGNPLGITALGPLRLLLLALAALALLAAAFVLGARARPPGWLRRAGVAGVAAALAVLSLEAAFQFVAQSHSVGYTMASNLWFERHWGPFNSLGYRDREHERVPGKRLVALLGDSFTAGHGILRDERYGERLAARRPDLHVLNLGSNGSDTRDELRRLREHPLQPDVLVLQYFPNDVEGAARACGMRVPGFQPYTDIRSVKLRFLVRGSYLANFLYWRFPREDLAEHHGFLERAFADAAVVARHCADLEAVRAYAQERGIPLVVVDFPLLHDVGRSRQWTAAVAATFRRWQVPVIDVAQLVAGLDEAECVVNVNDGHAGAGLNDLVAEALAAVLPRS